MTGRRLQKIRRFGGGFCDQPVHRLIADRFIGAGIDQPRERGKGIEIGHSFVAKLRRPGPVRSRGQKCRPIRMPAQSIKKMGPT